MLYLDRGLQNCFAPITVCRRFLLITAITEWLPLKTDEIRTIFIKILNLSLNFVELDRFIERFLNAYQLDKVNNRDNQVVIDTF